MKKSINRNILWSTLFIEELSRAGLNEACISPGSRSTPLVYALAQNKKIRKTVIIDERSSGFFALGMSKNSLSPVLLITTSGTAVAELYPAIIEAYKSRTPLIICTADRPPELLNRGANQTINQNNIFGNHIRWFRDAGLPAINSYKLKQIRSLANEAYSKAQNECGPVHINFPFRKPFEPSSYTDFIKEETLNSVNSYLIPDFSSKRKNKPLSKKIQSLVLNSKKGLILCNQAAYTKRDFSGIMEFARKFTFLVAADGISGLRFGYGPSENVLVNCSSYASGQKFPANYDPDLIIQFGTAPTSKQMLDFLENSKAKKIFLNEYSELHNPTLSEGIFVQTGYNYFCNTFLNLPNPGKNETDTKEWTKKIKTLESQANRIKQRHIYSAAFPFEGRIIPELLTSIKRGSNLFVSNSQAVRDLDYFAPQINGHVSLYVNRGASGIDGIIATASGIKFKSKKPTYLVIGDLAFLHDLNSLHLLKKMSLNLVIILIDNNGGGLFNMLPIANERSVFKKYFLTPHNMDFSPIIKAYGGHYSKIKSWRNLSQAFKEASERDKFSVLHIMTDSKKSLFIRQKYWAEVEKYLNSLPYDSKK